MGEDRGNWVVEKTKLKQRKRGGSYKQNVECEQRSERSDEETGTTRKCTKKDGEVAKCGRSGPTQETGLGKGKIEALKFKLYLNNLD